jgi:hypothetical protein
MGAGQQIIDGLKDALEGNFKRVTIDGQTWVLQDAEPINDMGWLVERAADAKDAIREWQQARLDIPKLQASGPKDPVPAENVRILKRLAEAEDRLRQIDTTS